MSKKYYGELKNNNDKSIIKMYFNNNGEMIFKTFKNAVCTDVIKSVASKNTYETILDYVRQGLTIKHLTGKAIYDLTQYIGIVDKDKDYMLLYAIPNEMTSYLEKNRNKYLEFENKLWG